MLIDLERRHPVALLPDRTADTFAQWLREHPGVTIIARDRSQAYADGAQQGAPAATQVADRFHLLQNLREALAQGFATHGQALEAVNDLMRQQPVPLSDGAVAVPVPPAEMPLPAQQCAAQRQAHRQRLHAQVWALHRDGWTARAIAQHVGLSLRTVQRDLRSATFMGRKRRSDRGDSVLNPYKPYILERWNAGCYTAMRLFRELQGRGYTGSYALVAAYARRLRQAQGLAPGHRCPRRTPAGRGRAPVSVPHAAPGDLARPPARNATHRGGGATTRLLTGTTCRGRRGRRPCAGLCHLVRQRRFTQLDPWLKRTTTSTLEAIQRFAAGLYEDYEAVKAGVTLPWSSGPVEGHINRLKMLKRQMFGRARLELLSRRFLLAPRPEQRHQQRTPEPVSRQHSQRRRS